MAWSAKATHIPWAVFDRAHPMRETLWRDLSLMTGPIYLYHTLSPNENRRKHNPYRLAKVIRNLWYAWYANGSPPLWRHNCYLQYCDIIYKEDAAIPSAEKVTFLVNIKEWGMCEINIWSRISGMHRGMPGDIWFRQVCAIVPCHKSNNGYAVVRGNTGWSMHSQFSLPIFLSLFRYHFISIPNATDVANLQKPIRKRLRGSYVLYKICNKWKATIYRLT